MSVPESEYFQERLVAFLDVLGFSNRVREAERDCELFERSLTALRQLGKGPPWWATAPASDLVSTSFSDNIVISSATDKTSVNALLQSVAYLAMRIPDWGSVLRGGVHVGLLYHEPGIVFGQAMISAYELAENVAIYPRVVVSKQAEALLSQLSLSAEFLTTDTDGQRFVDYFSYYSKLAVARNQVTGLREHLRSLHAVLYWRLSNEGDPDILKKYKWLAAYYNKVLSSRAEFGDLHPILLGRAGQPAL